MAKAKVCKRGGGFGGLHKYMKYGRKHEHAVKNAVVVSTNMAATSDRDLEREFMAVRALRPDIELPVEHHSISLPASDTLTPAQWDVFIRDYLEQMDIDTTKHQFHAMQHSDTDYLHVHIEINRVGLDGSVWLGQQSALNAIEVMQRLELKYQHKFGLTVTQGLNKEKKDRPLTRNEAKLAKRGERPIRLRLASIIREVRDRSKTFEELVDGLTKRGVTVAPNGVTGSVGGVSFKFEGVVFTGSKVAKDCAWKALSTAVGYDAMGDADLVASLRAAATEDIEVRKDAATKAREAVQLEELVDSAQSDLFEMRSVVTLKQVEAIESTLRHLVPLHAQRVSEGLRAQLVALGTHKGVEVYSSQPILRREKRLVRNAQLLFGDRHHDLTPVQQDAAIRAKELEASQQQGRPVAMSDEQRNAVRYALRGGYRNAQGSAGAGKSFSAAAIRLAYEERGYRVIGAAVGRRAASNLEEEAGIGSFTIAKLLSDIKARRVELDRRTCIVVDEAGQVGAGYADEIFKLAANAGAKVVLTGEDRQTDAIQHGGVLRFTSREDIVGTARVRTIKRQREAWAREAVENLRDGKMDAGLRAFEARGLVNWIGGGSEAVHERLIAAWRAYELSHPDKQSLIVTHTNADARLLAQRVREFRKSEGKVTGPEYLLSAQHGGKPHNLVLAVGDRIRFGQNAEERMNVINGTMGSVLSVRPVRSADGRDDLELCVQSDDRGLIQFRVSEYCDEKGRALLNQGYVTSIYSAQGLTVDGDVFVLQTPRMDRALTYVAASRAKDASHFFVDRAQFAALANSDSDSALRATLLDTAGSDTAEPLAVEVLAANDAGYLAREFAGIDDETRAQRDADMACPLDKDAEPLPETMEEAIKFADDQLWAMDSVMTRDRFEEVMVEMEVLIPNFANAVRAHHEPQLKVVGTDEGGRTLYSTEAIVEREVQMIRDIRTLVHDRHHDLSEERLEDAISEKEGRTGITMSDEQRLGVAHTLRGGFASLQGSAGAGKSTSMDAVRLAHRAVGYRMLGAAISRKAATNLEKEALIESRTIAKTLNMLDGGKLKLDERSCLVVDEAGQVGSGYLARLVRHAVVNGTKVVLTGEDRQLDAIQHGGVLRFLSREDVIGTARIQTIFRQDEVWARQAVADFRDGEMDSGLKALEEHGLVHWVRGGSEETQDRLIRYWREYEKANPEKQSIILAHSNATARELSERVRAIRREEGRIIGPEYRLRAIHGKNQYQVTLAQGDRIRCTMNSESSVGVINGTLGTILRIEPVVNDAGDPDHFIKVLTDDRGEVEFLASEYTDEKGRVYIGQANTSTIYSAQGLTINGEAFVYQSEMMDRANTYVAASRAKGDTHLFIDRDLAVVGAGTDSQTALRERLLRSMSRDSGKKMALETMADSDLEAVRELLVDHGPDSERIERFKRMAADFQRGRAVRERFSEQTAQRRAVTAADPEAATIRARFERESREAYIAKHGPAIVRPARQERLGRADAARLDASEQRLSVGPRSRAR